MIVSLVEEVLGTLQLHVKPYKNTTHIVRIIQKKKKKKTNVVRTKNNCTGTTLLSHFYLEQVLIIYISPLQYAFLLIFRTYNS
jgi:hypothetical protein